VLTGARGAGSRGVGCRSTTNAGSGGALANVPFTVDLPVDGVGSETSLPIRDQLSFVSSPIPASAQSTLRKRPLMGLKRTVVNGGLELAIARMQLGWRLAVEEHPDRDAVACAPGGKCASLPVASYQLLNHEAVLGRERTQGFFQRTAAPAANY
jgi:hypothetical protein